MTRAAPPREVRSPRGGAPASPSGKPAKSAASTAPREVRLIGGVWKRSRLPVADRPGLRPTPDRVRETLFNWLGQDLTGWRVLDAYAGSGALGFEAASRGAASVLLLERDAQLVASLRASRQRLKATQVEVRQADAISTMRSAAPGSFDLVLLDPPFDAGLFEASLAAARPLLADGGFIYLEAPSLLAQAPAGLQLYRHGRAGAVFFHLLQRADAGSAASPSEVQP
ncbi:16S rRNA (guanine(966)-N(2))-methyltransferase RsmD [Azohydromonas caseinilytica]|uniref:16S rRNA (Guanine(966)-N(2))-methyltransferase RsmD n=1 Tax=Azohydromonas caseinilytica TaxID=2728836 RepID=A0A848F3X5_9BURK|nr:16S rRNA (guanine(966)-N(2))-methyltransferase RsmD [Azohydromonas caseinilytica]NML13405.1 16S rRNA (guanine(966)-N(2))-methyltransferase RsmD [Azohydromonas caseinilytica]